jgi:hypothetical protein
MAQLSLRQIECTPLESRGDTTFPVLNSPKTSVILCVDMPPPSIASAVFEPVEIMITFCRRSLSSVADRKVGG